MELRIEVDKIKDDIIYFLKINNGIKTTILYKLNNFLIWTLPVLENERIIISVIAKIKGTNEIIFETNSIIVKIPQYNPEFEILDMEDEHPIIKVSDRTIEMPTNYNIILSNDANSQLLTFELNRYFDGIDLSKQSISVNFINAVGEKDSSIVVNVNVTDDKLRCGWLLDENVSSENGIVTFELEFLSIDKNNKKYLWQTLPASFRVEKSLFMEDMTIEEKYPTIIESIKIKLNNLDNRIVDLENRPVEIENLEDIVDNITIKINDENKIFVAPVDTGETNNHAELINLDYNSSGHTGFASNNSLINHINNLSIHLTAGERDKLILFKGFFLNSGLLIETYPSPANGAYAVVGSGESSTVWTALDGIWNDTGSLGNVTMADLIEEIVNRETEIERLERNISDLADAINDINIILNSKANKDNVLQLNNISPFIPQNDYEPSTKKYVDDNIIGRIFTRLLFLNSENNIPILTNNKPVQNVVILPTRYIGAEPNQWTEITRINAINEISDINIQFIPDNHFSSKIWFLSEMQRDNVQIRIQLIDKRDGIILASATSKTNLLSDGITPIPVSFDNVHQVLRDLPLSQVEIIISIMPLLFGLQIGMISNPPNEISFINIISTI